MTIAINALSLALKVVVIALMVNQLLVYFRFPAAIYKVTLPIWKRTGYRPGVSKALRVLANDQRRRGYPGTAVGLSREAVEFGLRRPSISLVLDFLNLAYVLRHVGPVENALGWFRLADSSTNFDLSWKGTILTGLGECLSTLGQYEEADQVLDRAWHLYDEDSRWRRLDWRRRTLGTPKFRRRVAGQRGYIALQAAKFDDALRWYEAVVALPARPNRRERLRNLNNLAAANVDLGDLAAADRYVEQVESISGPDFWPGKDYFLGTRGALRLKQGRFHDARADFTEVLKIRGSDPYPLIMLAQTACKEGAYPEAAGYVDRIEGDPTDHVRRLELATVLDQLVDAEVTAANPGRADERRTWATRLRQARPLSRPVLDDPLLYRARSVLSGLQFSGPTTLWQESLVMAFAVVGTCAAFLLVAGAVLFLPASCAAVLFEALALAIVTFLGYWFGNWLVAPKPVGPTTTQKAPA